MIYLFNVMNYYELNEGIYIKENVENKNKSLYCNFARLKSFLDGFRFTYEQSSSTVIFPASSQAT